MAFKKIVWMDDEKHWCVRSSGEIIPPEQPGFFGVDLRFRPLAIRRQADGSYTCTDAVTLQEVRNPYAVLVPPVSVDGLDPDTFPARALEFKAILSNAMRALGWMPIKDAPKDGRLLLLLTSQENDHTTELDEEVFARTVGYNNHTDDGEGDVWHFIGWDWSFDEFVNLSSPRQDQNSQSGVNDGPIAFQYLPKVGLTEFEPVTSGLNFEAYAKLFETAHSDLAPKATEE